MKEYIQQAKSKSRIRESNPKVSKQSINVIFQRYKEGFRNVLENDNKSVQGKFDTVQREKIDEKELLHRKNEFASTIIQEKKEQVHLSLKKMNLPLYSKDNSSSNRIIQRAFLAAYGIVGGVVLSAADNLKLIEVVNILNNMPDPALTNLNITITVDNLTDSNPAVTNLAGPLSINIDIHHWVVRKNSAAFIAGMIAHECGAHLLTDHEMTPADHATETHLNPLNRMIVAGGHHYTIHPAAGRPGAQQDHINSAKVDGNIALWSPRAKAYLHTFVCMGNEIIGVGMGPLTLLQMRKLNELLQTYLFDIARIIVEDDQANLGIILHTWSVSDVMNWLYGLITPPAPAVLPIPTQPANDWIRQLGFHSSSVSLFSMLALRFLGFLSAWVTTKVRGHL